MIVKNDTSYQTPGQFIGAHFADLIPNSYEINNTKFGLDLSTKDKSDSPGPKTRVITSFF